MLNNNFLPERTAPTRKQRDTQLNYPPLTNLINLLTANRKTSSLIYQDILSLSLSLWSIQSSRIFFLQSTTHLDRVPISKTSCKTSPPNVSCSREIRSSNQRSSLSEKLCEKKRRRYLDEDERMEDSVRRSSGRFFSPGSGDPLPVRITRIAGGVGGWRRGPNEISRYVNAGRRVLSLSLSMRRRGTGRGTRYGREICRGSGSLDVCNAYAVTGAQLPRPVSLRLALTTRAYHLPSTSLRRGYPTRFVLCNADA